MTEAEWLRCTDPTKMLEFLSGNVKGYDRVSDRKLRLFGCWCCRSVWHVIEAESARSIIELVERYAEGEPVTEERWVEASEEAWALNRSAIDRGEYALNWARQEAHAAPAMLVDFMWNGRMRIDAVSIFTAKAVAILAAEVIQEGRSGVHHGRMESGYAAQRVRHAGILHCVSGNPFRLCAVNSAWLTPTVVQLAQVAYDERHLPEGTLDSSRLAVLVDALEEAGCTDPEFLGHLRSAEAHTRGCWPLDLILGKT